MALANRLLAIEDLTVGIGGTKIASCQNLQVDAGQILILLGKNGSGKSTFLRTVCGLLKPISGNVLIKGHPLNSTQIHQEIAWLSQDEHSEFSWTVREYVGLGRLAHNQGLILSKVDQEKIEESLGQVDGIHLADRPMTELSGGERQRVRLARSLAQETPIIAMDEPTTHLDLDHQLQFLQLISALARQGKTILASLHDVSQAHQVGSQFMMFAQGHATWVSNSRDLTKEMLEATLGVRFEHRDGQFLPIYPTTIGH